MNFLFGGKCQNIQVYVRGRYSSQTHEIASEHKE